MLLVLEPNWRWFKDAKTLHEDIVRGVDENVGDGRILEQRLERAQAKKLVEDVGNQLFSFRLVQRLILLAQLFANNVADFRLDLCARHPIQRRRLIRSSKDW